MRAPQRGPIDSYVAYIGADDLYNSSGARLTKPAAIIRQDRANFHRFGIRDRIDESDTFFADEINRQALENMLANGTMSSSVARMIAKGGAIIQVDVYGSGSTGDWIEVTVLN